MSERFQMLSKRYMCSHMPEGALSVCTAKIEGNEAPNAIDCLLCASKTLIQITDSWFMARLVPPQTAQAAEYLENLRASYEHIKIAFSVMAKKFKPSFVTESEEVWADNVEILLSKLKEGKASE